MQMFKRLGQILGLTLGLMMVCGAAHAAVYKVNNSMSESNIQSTVKRACGSRGNTVSFAAGNYTGWITTLNVPAGHGCILTGPEVSSRPVAPSVILNSDGRIPTIYTIMAFTDCSGAMPGAAVTIEYLAFDNTAGIYKPASCSGYEITHNLFENNNPPIGSNYFPSIEGAGSGTDLSTGWDVSWNAFENNCATIKANYKEQGGYCAADFENGALSNGSWVNNYVDGIEQGFKTPPSAGYLSNVTITGNYFINFHRIAIETQYATRTSASTTRNNISYNYFGPPYKPCYFTFANSIPMYGASPPAFISEDNVIVANSPTADDCSYSALNSGSHYGIAMEVWGSGIVVRNNLVEGGPVISSGFSPFSLGAGSGARVTDNISCGYAASHAGAVGIDTSAGAPTRYIISPNTWSLACPRLTIPKPAISPAGGAFGSSPTVTVSESRANTTIYCTRDGSTPTVNSPVYTGAFKANLPSTVKCIAQWGTGANIGISFPRGYGYTPSNAASATYTSLSPSNRR